MQQLESSASEDEDEEQKEADELIEADPTEDQEMINAYPYSNRISSNIVSTLHDPSFCIESSHRQSDPYANHPGVVRDVNARLSMDPRQMMSGQADAA